MPTSPPMLEDGQYDVFIVDAEAEADEALHLVLTVLAGPHKGEVVTVRASGLGVSEVDAIGMPATLRVHDGQPHVTVD